MMDRGSLVILPGSLSSRRGQESSSRVGLEGSLSLWTRSASGMEWTELEVFDGREGSGSRFGGRAGTDRLRVAKLRSRHLPLAASFISPPPPHTPRASAGFSSVGDTQLKPSGIPDSGPLDSGRPGHPRVQEPRNGRPEPQGEWGGLGVPTSLRLISFLYLRLVASVASTAGGTNSVGGECNCN